jgi:hypothetical protein
MSIFTNASEVEAVFAACCRRFLASADGAAAAAAAGGLDSPVVVLRFTHPDATLSIDLAGRTVSAGAADEPAAQLEVEADAVHDVLLGRLGPVQISRLFEEDRAVVEGTPEALRFLLTLAGSLASHYPETLRELGRVDLLELPAPELEEVWESTGPPKRVIGKRRPWQRQRATA